MPDETEDLVQETLLAIHLKRHTYDITVPLTPWIYAIARYKLIDLFRRRSGRDDLTDTLENDAEIFTESDNETIESRKDLTQLLNRLPERLRTPIILTKLQGLSVREAAQAANMSVSAIKIGVHRGLRALAEIVRDTDADR